MTFRMALALAATLTATSASAQRISIPTFSGPSAASARNQLVGTLCDTADCVAAAKTTTSNKPDWKKAKKESVQFFVTGAVVKKGKGLQLDLAVLNKAGPPKAKKSFPLEKSGTLAPKNLQAVMDLLTGAFGGGRGAEPTPAEPVKPAPTRDPATSSSVAGKAPTRPPDPPVERTAALSAPEREAPREAAPPPQRRRKAKFLVIDVGVEVLNRRLEYSQVATSNLRRYELTAFAQPTVGVEFYPLALVRDDLLAGLGVEASVAFAPWLQSRLASVTDSFPTSALRVDAGLRWDIAPIPSFALTFSPFVGVRSQSFTVSSLPDGRSIDGLPDISVLGLRAGMGVDVPVVPGWVTLFGRVGLVPVFSGGEILSAAFFPSGSAFGLEADAGLGVSIVPMLQVRASFEWANYAFTFRTQPTDTYVAAGATDTYLGGKATLRLRF